MLCGKMEYVGKYRPLELVKVVSLYRYPMLFITGIHTFVGRAPSLGRGRAVRCKSAPPQRIRAFHFNPWRNIPAGSVVPFGRGQQK